MKAMQNNSKEFKIIRRETPYQGFFRLEKYRLKHTLFAGGWTRELDRELFRRGNCVAVLLYDPKRDEIILIEQFRVGAILHQEQPWLLEIVAGAIEEGETAEQVAAPWLSGRADPLPAGQTGFGNGVCRRLAGKKRPCAGSSC